MSGFSGVHGQVGAFPAGRGFPVPLANGAAAAAVQNAHGGVVLLGAVDAVGEVVVRDHAVELAGGLVVIVVQFRPPSELIWAPPSSAIIMRLVFSGAIHRSWWSPCGALRLSKVRPPSLLLWYDTFMTYTTSSSLGSA